MSLTTISYSYFCVGKIVFVKASQVLSAGDLGLLNSSRAPKIYITGLITHCEIRESSGGRLLRYLTCHFFLGGVQEKLKEVDIQCTKICPPDSCFHLEFILAYDIDTHLSETTLEDSATQLSQELEEAMSDFPIHRWSDLSAGVKTADCQGVEWSTDQQLTLLDCN